MAFESSGDNPSFSKEEIENVLLDVEDTAANIVRSGLEELVRRKEQARELISRLKNPIDMCIAHRRISAGAEHDLAEWESLRADAATNYLEEIARDERKDILKPIEEEARDVAGLMYVLDVLSHSGEVNQKLLAFSGIDKIKKREIVDTIKNSLAAEYDTEEDNGFLKSLENIGTLFKFQERIEWVSPKDPHYPYIDSDLIEIIMKPRLSDLTYKLMEMGVDFPGLDSGSTHQKEREDGSEHNRP